MGFKIFTPNSDGVLNPNENKTKAQLKAEAVEDSKTEPVEPIICIFPPYSTSTDVAPDATKDGE